MRKYYIDNLRVLCILLLFPFHTSMIYNNWGELFYVTSTPRILPSMFVTFVYPWWMTLLFTVAGISSYYALSRRSAKEYAKNRLYKLLIPVVFGLILIIPVQSYIADIFYNNYQSGYLEHYKIFFTRFTYLTGQDGGFTPGHLWFIFYLFVISMVMLPFMKKYINSDKKINYDKISITTLLLLVIPVALLTPILNIAGKSIGESLMCFAIGFFILSNDKVVDKLEKNIILPTAIFLVMLTVGIYVQLHNINGKIFETLWVIGYRIYMWTGILTFLGLAKKYLNFKNATLSYLSKAAFSMYYFHQSILIILAFFALKCVSIAWIQFIIIVICTFVFTLLCYETFRRFRLTAFMFGIKHKTISVYNKESKS